jgi:FKBP-type peptidyl-prolyl cis-trans isomerase 2
MTRARTGDVVKIHITGRTSDGVVFESTEGCGPRLVEVGGNQLVDGLKDSLVGMEEGEELTVVIPPEKGFGHHKPNAKHVASVDLLPEGIGEGDRLFARVGEKLIKVWVKEIGTETVVLDENHPLAGKTLGYDLKLVSVET